MIRASEAREMRVDRLQLGLHLGAVNDELAAEHDDVRIERVAQPSGKRDNVAAAAATPAPSSMSRRFIGGPPRSGGESGGIEGRVQSSSRARAPQQENRTREDKAF